MKFFDWLYGLFHPTITVCHRCLRVSDEHVDEAGDYSVCQRCNKSIWMGFEVRERP